MNEKSIATSLRGGLLTLALLLSGAGAQTAGAADPETVLRERCATCHADDAGTLTRIVGQRKTPEGWLMTLVRMQHLHGLKISDDERRDLVKYLADTQGLAPQETAGARYALERRLNTQESFESEQFTQMCARCHSGARVMLQRRTEDEWAKLVNFHLGQFPTAEYQALARDRDWFGLALGEVVPDLAKRFAFDAQQWRDWQQRLAAQPPQVAGAWSVSGHVPGKGGFTATMTVKAATGKDQYAVTLQGRYDDGAAVAGQGQAVIYTGYEWRANLDVDGVPMRQVFALEGDVLRGRMFQREHDEVGADVVAARQDGASRVLAVHPAYLKVGEAAQLTIVGSALQGEPVLPAGVKLIEVVERSPGRVVVKAVAEAGAGVQGVHAVRVGQAEGGQLAVYDKLERIQVVPAFAVARIGGNGGSQPKVEARFEAEAFAVGPQGEYRVGLMPAKWSVTPFNEVAEHDQDVKFTGVMDAASGIFTPGGAGPNPERRMMTNNAGNLNVVAEVADAAAGGQALTAQGQLIVTMQRWNNPPVP